MSAKAINNSNNSDQKFEIELIGRKGGMTYSVMASEGTAISAQSNQPTKQSNQDKFIVTPLCSDDSAFSQTVLESNE